MKIFFFLALLVACSVNFISADTTDCLQGAAACANHNLVSHENGQTFCCPSGYTGIATSGSVVNGVHHEVCICHN